MFISLRKYLESRPEQVANALLRALSLLLETLETQSVPGQAADYEQFRAEIRHVAHEFEKQPSAPEVLVAAGRFAKAVEQYNGRTGKFIELQCSELQSMVAMLTRAVATVSTGSEQSIARLHDIESQLHSACQVEDFQTAKARMSDCLDGLRDEIARQHVESAHTVNELKTAIERTNERTATRSGVEARKDPLTGLPERAAAEAALFAGVRDGAPLLAAAFFVQSLDLINLRFGHEVGDQVLLFLRGRVAEALLGTDRLFRWSGPAFLALIERGEPAQKVREQLGRSFPQRLSHTVTIGDRSVILPVSARWAVFDPAEIQPFSHLMRSIDHFLHGAAVDSTAPSGAAPAASATRPGNSHEHPHPAAPVR